MLLQAELGRWNEVASLVVPYKGFCFVHWFDLMFVRLGWCLIYLSQPRAQHEIWHVVGIYSVFGDQILNEKKMRMAETKKKRQGIYSFTQQWQSTYCVPGL